MANAAMQKGIRQELPNHPIVDYQTRHQARIEFEIPPAKRQEGAKQDLQKINNDAGDDDALHPKGKGRKAQRECSPAIHEKLSVLSSQLPVSRRRCPPPHQVILPVCAQRSGMGVTGRLLWPSPSTAPRAKITLSFEIGSVAR